MTTTQKMKTLKKSPVKASEAISPELAALLGATRHVDEIDKKALADSIRALERSTKHVADTRKASFVEDVLRTLHEQGLTKSELARRLGKDRQQLNYMLNENKLNNFTIDTMAQISTALGQHLFVRMLGSHEHVRIDSTALEYVCTNELKNWETDTWSDLPIFTEPFSPPTTQEKINEASQPDNIINFTAA